MANADAHPLVKAETGTIPGAAATTSYDQILAVADWDGELSAASFAPEASITGNTTNTRTLTIVNKGADGTGTTVMATIAFITGNNGVAYVPKDFVLSVVEGATSFEAGDSIAVSSAYAASGLADPGGLVKASLSRALAL